MGTFHSQKKIHSVEKPLGSWMESNETNFAGLYHKTLEIEFSIQRLDKNFTRTTLVRYSLMLVSSQDEKAV